LLQKKYTVDFLTKKQKVNEGEIPQYYVENSHPGIISVELFDIVQQELARRRGLAGRYSDVGFFASRIITRNFGMPPLTTSPSSSQVRWLSPSKTAQK
ncbi:MAG: recombinase family protein, partial [Oscillospiraceae bacterium]|nr:recombinase family protein [Oscillospiraceae bacterium]